jgi:hypothetical protein
MDPATFSAATRRSLHGVAELILAGPQYRLGGRIELRVVPDGFATIVEPDLRVTADGLVTPDRVLPLTGTYAELGRLAGVDAGALEEVYGGGSGVTAGEEIIVERSAAEYLLRCYILGDEALRRLGGADAPVLWPEHFDAAITLDEINYGVSPGDEYVAEPYAYVGPWRPREGAFWNAPFGAARPVRTLGDAAAITAFFVQGRELARGAS